MEANELRIGNFVKLVGVGEDMEVCVLAIDTKQIHYNLKLKVIEKINYLRALFCYIEPMPITIEWVHKIEDIVTTSFGNIVINLTMDDQDDTPFFFWDNKIKTFSLLSGNKEEVIIQIDYVHQFQNLYLALRGEELKFKK